MKKNRQLNTDHFVAIKLFELVDQVFFSSPASRFSLVHSNFSKLSTDLAQTSLTASNVFLVAHQSRFDFLTFRHVLVFLFLALPTNTQRSNSSTQKQMSSKETHSCMDSIRCLRLISCSFSALRRLMSLVTSPQEDRSFARFSLSFLTSRLELSSSFWDWVICREASCFRRWYSAN